MGSAQMWALISVHDKSGLVPFAESLIARGFGLVASGGTARALSDAGLPVRTVDALTRFPELLAGRVKTLHPAVHAGILSRRDAADSASLAAHGIDAIDLVAVSLYPFADALARGAAEAEQIEEIDIGGVTLLRAAAKNFHHVTVVPGHAHYDDVIAGLDGDLAALRRRMAGIAFAITAAYDRAVAGWLGAAPLGQVLRYGENPHQYGWFAVGSTRFEQHGGKALSYNNLLDLDAAWSTVAEQRVGHNAVVVKHGSPCGIARATSTADAITRAIAADPISAFGGIVAVDQPLDRAAVDAFGDLFLEVVAAPSITDEALDYLRHGKKNLRIVTLSLALAGGPRSRTVLGGELAQAPDLALPNPAEWTTPTVCQFADHELLMFAWLAVKHVKSNAIVLAARDGDALVTVGIGGGQTNRIDAVRQACERAGDRARGAVLASDAFFPFADGVEVAAHHGVVAVMQPGGAIRDAQVIAHADALDLAMVLTHRRHFRH